MDSLISVRRRCVEVGLKEGQEIGGEALGFVVGGGADVRSGGLEQQGLALVQDLVGEIEADAFSGGEPELDGQEVVVARGSFVEEAGFDDGEKGLVFLELEKGHAEVTEEFAAGGFQEIEVTGIINVVAEGALGVSDAMGMLEGGGGHAANFIEVSEGVEGNG